MRKTIITTIMRKTIITTIMHKTIITTIIAITTITTTIITGEINKTNNKRVLLNQEALFYFEKRYKNKGMIKNNKK